MGDRNRVGMTNQVFNDFFNNKITHKQMMVMFGLLCAAKGKCIIFTDPESLAQEMGEKWNKRNVGAAIKGLIEGGYISRVTTSDLQGYELNTAYFLTEDVIQKYID